MPTVMGHGPWDEKIPPNAMVEKWEDWLSENNPNSYIHKDRLPREEIVARHHPSPQQLAGTRETALAWMWRASYENVRQPTSLLNQKSPAETWTLSRPDQNVARHSFFGKGG